VYKHLSDALFVKVETQMNAFTIASPFFLQKYEIRIARRNLESNGINNPPTYAYDDNLREQQMA
jgi:hypothetical protein